LEAYVHRVVTLIGGCVWSSQDLVETTPASSINCFKFFGANAA
jgi:hypothetical protein